jgi:predicted nucleic acid-binding protein
MKRVAIDTNIVDHIADTPGLLEACEAACSRGDLLIVVTHVQMDELLAICDEARRAKLLRACSALKVHTVSTSGAVWNESTFDQAQFSDEEGGITLGQLKGGGDHPMRDALIGATAIDADAFVTNETRLHKRIRRLPDLTCQIWTTADLEAYVNYTR